MAPPFVLIECLALRPGFAHGNGAYLTAPGACEQAVDGQVKRPGPGLSASSVYTHRNLQPGPVYRLTFVTIYLHDGVKTFHGLRKCL